MATKEDTLRWLLRQEGHGDAPDGTQWSENGETVWIIRNPIGGELNRYSSKEDATKAALAKNRAHPDHPAFELWHGAKFVGTLWRGFGCDFDETDPWRKRWATNHRRPVLMQFKSLIIRHVPPLFLQRSLILR